MRLEMTRERQFEGTRSVNFTPLSMVIAFSLLFASPTALCAQDNAELVVTLLNRVGNLEEGQRELRGQLEEVRHDLSILQKKMELLNADIDLRFNTPESGSDSLTMGVPESAEHPPPLFFITYSRGRV